MQAGCGAMEEPEPTSRLCVKNLPAYVDENRLREHFGEKGEVTDAKVVRAGCVAAVTAPHTTAFPGLSVKTRQIWVLFYRMYDVVHIARMQGWKVSAVRLCGLQKRGRGRRCAGLFQPLLPGHQPPQHPGDARATYSQSANVCC